MEHGKCLAFSEGHRTELQRCSESLQGTVMGRREAGLSAPAESYTAVQLKDGYAQMTQDSDVVESAKEVTETGTTVDVRSGQWVGAGRSQRGALT